VLFRSSSASRVVAQPIAGLRARKQPPFRSGERAEQGKMALERTRRLAAPVIFGPCEEIGVLCRTGAGPRPARGESFPASAPRQIEPDQRRRARQRGLREPAKNTFDNPRGVRSEAGDDPL